MKRKYLAIAPCLALLLTSCVDSAVAANQFYVDDFYANRFDLMDLSVSKSTESHTQSVLGRDYGNLHNKIPFDRIVALENFTLEISQVSNDSHTAYYSILGNEIWFNSYLSNSNFLQLSPEKLLVFTGHTVVILNDRGEIVNKKKITFSKYYNSTAYFTYSGVYERVNGEIFVSSVSFVSGIAEVAKISVIDDEIEELESSTYSIENLSAFSDDQYDLWLNRIDEVDTYIDKPSVSKEYIWINGRYSEIDFSSSTIVVGDVVFLGQTEEQALLNELDFFGFTYNPDASHVSIYNSLKDYDLDKPSSSFDFNVSQSYRFALGENTTSTLLSFIVSDDLFMIMTHIRILYPMLGGSPYLNRTSVFVFDSNDFKYQLFPQESYFSGLFMQDDEVFAQINHQKIGKSNPFWPAEGEGYSIFGI